jgi:hypothetical protein
MSVNCYSVRTIGIRSDIYLCHWTRNIFKAPALSLALTSFCTTIFRCIVPIISAPMAGCFKSCWVGELKRIV